MDTDEYREKVANLRYRIGEHIEFEYDSGTKVAGYIQRIVPEEDDGGPIKLAYLRDAKITNSAGNQIDRVHTLPIVPGRLTDFE